MYLYVAYGDDGAEHVLGPEFAGEFVTDFLFHFEAIKQELRSLPKPLAKYIASPHS